jgi:hypothetical protein
MNWIFHPYFYVAIHFVAIVGVFGFIEVESAEVKCDKRWENSGLNTSYTILGGCQVRLPSGKWIPEDRVRQSDIITDYED